MRNFFAILFCILGFSSCGNAQKSLPAKEKFTIAILPFRDFSEARTQSIAKEIESFYHVKVVILPVVANYVEARLNETERYDARIILSQLAVKLPKDCDKILGLSSKDIFTDKKVNGINYPQWGVFGLGYQPGKACVISDYRLKKFGKKTDSLVIKVALHEMGHTFGLPHCNRDKRCMMNDARGTVKTLFHEEKWLCPHCSGIIKNQTE